DMLSARLQAIGGTRTPTSQDSQLCRLLTLFIRLAKEKLCRSVFLALPSCESSELPQFDRAPRRFLEDRRCRGGALRGKPLLGGLRYPLHPRCNVLFDSETFYQENAEIVLGLRIVRQRCALNPSECFCLIRWYSHTRGVCISDIGLRNWKP